MKKLTPEQIRENAELDYLVYEIVDTVCDTIKSCGGEVGANVPTEARIAVRKVLVKEHDRQRRIKAMMRFDTHVQAAVWPSPKKESAQENRAADEPKVASGRVPVSISAATRAQFEAYCRADVYHTEKALRQIIVRRILEDHKLRFGTLGPSKSLRFRADYARVLDAAGALPLVEDIALPKLKSLVIAEHMLRREYPDYPLTKGKNNG